ncbi:hypothetical protein MMPV_009094 [Pyropia vietnamensis]
MAPPMVSVAAAFVPSAGPGVGAFVRPSRGSGRLAVVSGRPPLGTSYATTPVAPRVLSMSSSADHRGAASDADADAAGTATAAAAAAAAANAAAEEQSAADARPRGGGGGWGRAVISAVAAAAAVVGGGVRPASATNALVSRFYARDGARGANPVVTMTDQTSSYALPSQLAAGEGGAAEGPSVLTRAVRTAKAVAPGAAVTAVVVVGGGAALKSWRDRRLRAFQQQLSGLDSIFGDLGLDPSTGGAAGAAPADTAQMAKDILERSKTRYKFRDDDKPMKSAQPTDGANVQLDLFQGKGAKGPSGAAPPAPGGASATKSTPAFDMNENDIPAPPPGTTTAIKLPGATSPGAVRKVTGEPTAAGTAATARSASSAAATGGGGVPAPTNAVETAIAAAFSSTSADTAALASGLRSAISSAGVAVPSSRPIFKAYASALVSATIDAAAADVGNDAKGATALMDRLAAASAAITRASALSRELYGGGPTPSLADEKNANPVPTAPLDLTYMGAYKGAPAQQEELYRRYAVWCLSSEQRMSSDVQSLVDMQALLGVSDARAEVINTDIAKGMFDVAVNAAMADGDLDDENRKQLQVLKDSFGELLDGDAAAAGAGARGMSTDSATALKTMGALQELLKNQHVSPEDVAELRRLCKQMGVDIDDMLASADAMSSQLPAEAKQFVESIRGLLKGGR